MTFATHRLPLGICLRLPAPDLSGLRQRASERLLPARARRAEVRRIIRDHYTVR